MQSATRLIVFIWLAFALAAPLAAAPPVLPPPSPDPATFRDWTLTCAARCAAATSVRAARGAELLRLSVSPDPGGQLSIFTALPLYLPDPATLALGDTEPRTVDWLTCRATGCEARIPLSPDVLRDLRRQRDGSVALTLLDGSRVRLNVSLLGFTDAFAALGATTVP